MEGLERAFLGDSARIFVRWELNSSGPGIASTLLAVACCGSLATSKVFFLGRMGGIQYGYPYFAFILINNGEYLFNSYKSIILTL